MDNEYGYSYGYTRNPMATAAVVLGVISLFTCLIFYISIPCGALAVLFAILSRGRNPMPGKSKTGIVCGAIGIFLSAAITVSSVWMVLTNNQMRAYMERYLQNYLGDASFDLDKELVTMFPALKSILGYDDSGDDSRDDFEDDLGDDFRTDEPSRQLPDGEGDFI